MLSPADVLLLHGPATLLAAAVATLRTVAVECREPGLTLFPSGRADNVEAVSVLTPRAACLLPNCQIA